jgi:hypothetical protein
MVALGRTLVAVGVAVWPVWGGLYLADAEPHVGYAIAAHLALVIPGGSILRAHRPEAHRRSPGRRLGTWLITFGVLAWVPYFLLGGGDRVVTWPFLAWHLSGVIPGAVLRYTPLGDRVLNPPPTEGAPGPAGPGRGDT